MKEYRVLVACGSGIATSTVIATRVRELLDIPAKWNKERSQK